MGLLSEHPSIVTVLEAGFLDDGRPYLVMAFMPEGSLEDRIREGPMGWQEATRVGVKLAGALDTSHQAGVLHRDVKPANVLMSQYGEPQLADFGIARVAGGAETSSGVITASLAYAPPEIVDGQRPSVASDVYSLGATLHALMAGKAPFWKEHDDSVAALLNRVMNHPPPDLSEIGVPPDVADALQQAMAKDPADRPRSSAQFGRLLRLAQDANGLRPTQLTVYKPTDEPPSAVEADAGLPTEVAPTATSAGESTSAEPARAAIDDSAGEIRPAKPDREGEVAATPTGERLDESGSPTVTTPHSNRGDVATDAIETSGTDRAAKTGIADLGATVSAPPAIGGSTTEVPGRAVGVGAWWRRRSVRIGAGALGLALVLGAGFALTRSDEPNAASPATVPTTAVEKSPVSSVSLAGSEFTAPGWWSTDGDLAEAVVVDRDTSLVPNFVIGDPRADSPQWVTHQGWYPDVGDGLMTITVNPGEVDLDGNVITTKEFVRSQGTASGSYAAVFRLINQRETSQFVVSLESVDRGSEESHRAFGLTQGGGTLAAYTVEGETETLYPLTGITTLEPGISYDVLLLARSDGRPQVMVWRTDEPPADSEGGDGHILRPGSDWAIPGGWVPRMAVYTPGSISIDEYWGFDLAGSSEGFVFPDWWLNDPDWAEATVIHHDPHDVDSATGIVSDAPAWLISSSEPAEQWSPNFESGVMTIEVGPAAADSHSLQRQPPSSTAAHAAVFRFLVNDLATTYSLSLGSSSEPHRGFGLDTQSDGSLVAFTVEGDSPEDRFDLDRAITLEPGTWYDLALVAEPTGNLHFLVWPSGAPAASLSATSGLNLDMGEDWFPTGWHSHINVFGMGSLSIDEYWEFELPASSAFGAGDYFEDFEVGLIFGIGGRGDQSFNDSAAAGLDRAVADFGIMFSEATANEDGSNREELLNLQADESNLVVAVGFLFADPLANAAEANPGVDFVIVDDATVDLPNVAGAVFAEEQGSFLVGAAAALKTETDTVGFIGGVKTELIQRFEAGFVAGARAVNPDIEVERRYISEPPDFDGFSDPAAAKVIAQSMFERGADIVYHAAGGSGVGLFQAAKEFSEAGNPKVWAIGVDSDQYLAAGLDVRDYILTSMVKRVDVAVYDIVEAAGRGDFAAGVRVFDLSVDGVGYATSGGFINDIVDQLEDYKNQIVSGAIVVPQTP
jgi:basic membrane protein A